MILAVLLLSALFLAGSYTLARKCPMNNDPRPKHFAEPPSWVFAVVWPVLYVSLAASIVMHGSAYAKSRKTTSLVKP
jgi:tryptophan-rich sensory protein